jgi:hypothetical protein
MPALCHYLAMYLAKHPLGLCSLPGQDKINISLKLA